MLPHIVLRAYVILQKDSSSLNSSPQSISGPGPAMSMILAPVVFGLLQQKLVGEFNSSEKYESQLG